MGKYTQPPKVEVLPEGPSASPGLDARYAELKARLERMNIIEKYRLQGQLTKEGFPILDIGRFVDDPSGTTLSESQVSECVELFSMLAERYGFAWHEAVDVTGGTFDETKFLGWADTISSPVQQGELILVGMAMKALLAAPTDRSDRIAFQQYVTAKIGTTARETLRAELPEAPRQSAPPVVLPVQEPPVPVGAPDVAKGKPSLAQRIWGQVKGHPVKAALVGVGMLLAAAGSSAKALGSLAHDKVASLGQSAMASVGSTLARLMGLDVAEQELRSFVGNFRDTATDVGQALKTVVQNPRDTTALSQLSDSVFRASSRRRALRETGFFAHIPSLEDHADVPAQAFSDQAATLFPAATGERARALGTAVLADAALRGESVDQSLGALVRSLYTDPDTGKFTPSAALHEIAQAA